MADKDVLAFIASNRFGYGARPGELSAISSAPRDWLKSQVSKTAVVPPSLASFTGSKPRIVEIFSATMQSNEKGNMQTRQIAMEQSRPEILAKFKERIVSQTPLVERMTAFWTNHFSASRTKKYMGALLPTYEREAIRPHIFGKFSDMLLAVETHPVMQIYLDNTRSRGPNSPLGKRRDTTDLNENLAREILELHTLGVNGGYDQSDVEELAKILTGWNLPAQNELARRNAVRRALNRHGVQEFQYGAFYGAFHEPGTKRVLGKVYEDSGAQQLIDVLSDLSRHPSTAHFLATKLVRHFVADEPPPAATEALAQTFLETDGDLAQVTTKLIEMDEIWQDVSPKAKTPQDYVVSVMRGLGAENVRGEFITAPLQQMGQTPYNAGSPQGWPDTAADWIAPSSLMRRIEWAHAIAIRGFSNAQPEALFDNTIAPIASAQTRKMVRGAPTRQDGVALVLASLEFQRR